MKNNNSVYTFQICDIVEFKKVNLIKIRWTKNKNTHFFTLWSLVWKWVGLQYTSIKSVRRIFVLNIEKDWSIRTKIIAWKPFCLQMDDDDGSKP